MQYGHGSALASCLGTICKDIRGDSTEVRVPDLLTEARREESEKSSWLSEHEDPNFENSGMCLKMSTTPLSLHSFIALAAWPDGMLISSPSNSDDFCQGLAGEVVLCICVSFFLP